MGHGRCILYFIILAWLPAMLLGQQPIPARMEVGFQRHPNDTLVCQGGTARFFAAGNPGRDFQYQWTRYGVNLRNSDRIEGAQSPVLSIRKVNLADTGFYDCTIRLPGDTRFARISDLATLSVATPFERKDSIRLCQGDDFKLPSGRIVGRPGTFYDYFPGRPCDTLYITKVNLADCPGDWDGESWDVDVFPDPESGRISIRFGNVLDNTCNISILSLAGENLGTWKLAGGMERLQLDFFPLIRGKYWLKIAFKDRSVIKQLEVD